MNPMPNINFVEWDGLTRIIYTRKNKCLSAIFKSKSVQELLTKNYSIFCSLQNKPVPEDFDIKAVIEKILMDVEMLDTRSRTMSNDQILKLLAGFNKEGIHFSS